MLKRSWDIVRDVVATRGRGVKHATARRVDGPIVVLESDDWGGERMRTRATRDALVRCGALPTESDYHNDALERTEDLYALAEVLASVRDADARPAVLSTFVNPANPDFDAIRSNGVTEYEWEPMTRSLARRGDEREVMAAWSDLIEKGLLAPEYHGREHLNVRSWMDALRRDPLVRAGFDHSVFSVVARGFPTVLDEFRAAYFFRDQVEVPVLREAIVAGARLFEGLFGRAPHCFCPPNNVFHPSLYSAVDEAGIQVLASPLRRVEPDCRGGSRQVWRWDRPGRASFRTVARNAIFEPSAGFDAANCLRQIASAFRWGVPAIVSTHRVHYVGTIDTAHRDRGLRALRELLQAIIRAWPAVRFLSSGALNEQMKTEPQSA